MIRSGTRSGRPEELLAALLRYGTWLATMAIGIGFGLALVGARQAQSLDLRIVTAGIALFILLPVLRVALMMLMFFREGDFRFASIAGVVLATILLGLILGISEP